MDGGSQRGRRGRHLPLQWFVDFSGTGNSFQDQFTDLPSTASAWGAIPATWCW
ncbi:MAG: hypothetical protein WKG07_26060 [Hymenobacter sp.]